MPRCSKHSASVRSCMSAREVSVFLFAWCLTELQYEPGLWVGLQLNHCWETVGRDTQDVEPLHFFRLSVTRNSTWFFSKPYLFACAVTAEEFATYKVESAEVQSTVLETIQCYPPAVLLTCGYFFPGYTGRPCG